MSDPFGNILYGRQLNERVNSGDITLDEAFSLAALAHERLGVPADIAMGNIDWRAGAGVSREERVEALFPYHSFLNRQKRGCSHCGNTSGEKDSRGMCASCGAAL